MYKFQPILKSTIWGGEKIVPYKQIASGQTQVGESWELSGVKGNESVVAGGPEAGTTLPGLIARHGAALLGKANFERFGEEFPLLIKFIDARQDLSIQVHPDDRLAWERHKSKGKTEMWYVVDADKGARLRSGFAKQVTPAQYEASVEDNTITDILAEYEIHPGDLFFLPAGRVHSIGAGAFIAEIQQTSDITYRIYDFNRKDADGNVVKQYGQIPSPGDIIYEDIDGNGDVTDADRAIIGNPFPKFSYGINLGATWKGFDLSMFWQGVSGLNRYCWETTSDIRGNLTDRFLDRWTEDNTGASMPRVGSSMNDKYSSFWLEDASYLRLKNLEFGYTFRQEILRKASIQSIRLYFSGGNLATITKLKNWDPEKSSGDARADVHPGMRTYSFGVNVQF